MNLKHGHTNMIKKLQHKFVFIAVLSLFIVEFVIIGSINFINIYQINEKSNRMLEMICNNDGVFPDFDKSKPKINNDNNPPPENQQIGSNDKFFNDKDINAETKYVTRFFTVNVNDSNEITKVDTSQIAAVTSDNAKEYAKEALDSKKERGWCGNYKYQIAEKDDGKLIVFIDDRLQNDTKYQFLGISCAIGFAGLLVVGFLIAIFSKRAIRPIIESMEKQKQFVTDAGHEIKTPLAIISANTEVLEIENGESEWTDSIKNQTKRLSDLVKNLLTLSKIDEDIKMVFAQFNLSDAVYDVSYPFETLAQTRNKSLAMDIQNDLNFIGDEGMIRQLASILLDNAIKYADENSEIKLSLKKELKSINLTVMNFCSKTPTGDLSKLFERFYRADSSRARETGGYGIGLSIAKAITDSHDGKISAKMIENQICFEVAFPLKYRTSGLEQ